MDKTNKTKNLAYCALFTALIAVGAFIRVPVPVVPFTLQYLFTMLAGLLLGPRLGTIAVGTYVLLGLVGLPIFTQGGGLSYLLQPTCGFLIGLIPTAWLIGLLTAKRELRPLRTAAACLAGLAMLYAVGLPYMAVILNGYMGKGMDVSAILWAGMLPFLPGDMLKIAVTALLAPLLGFYTSQVLHSLLIPRLSAFRLDSVFFYQPIAGSASFSFLWSAVYLLTLTALCARLFLWRLRKEAGE